MLSDSDNKGIEAGFCDLISSGTNIWESISIV